MTTEDDYRNESNGAFIWIDYLLFGLFLCISLTVGVFHAWKAWRNRRIKHQESNASKLLYQGDGEMPIIPIALSLLTTFLSGVTMLGTPSELYARGLHFWVYYLMGCVAFAISGFLFLPIFYNLQCISIYEYFERRFHSKFCRLIASFLFEVSSCFYMAVVLYGPATALAKVTNVADGKDWPWILCIGVVCTFYTSIGGLKAVVWTDTIQAFFMYLGVGIMIVKGIVDSGGLARVFEIASETRRLETATWLNPTPFQYTSFWIAIFGGLAFWLSLYGLNQMAIQRYCSLPSERHAKIVICITVPAFLVLGSCACFIGIIALSYFYDTCDPFYRPGDYKIKPDQLVILFAVKMLKILPGLPGLFLACIFSATLSTFSSGMNSQAAVLWEDFLKPLFGHKLDNDQVALLNKLLVVGFGVIATALAFLAPVLGGIVQACFSFMGALSGPLVGFFFLGALVPYAHKWPALISLVISAAITVFLIVGQTITKPYANFVFPSNTTNCGPNVTVPSNELLDSMRFGDPDAFILFRMSSYIPPFIGIVLVIILGALISLCWKDPDCYDANGNYTDAYRHRRYYTLFRKPGDSPDELLDGQLSYELQQKAKVHPDKKHDYKHEHTVGDFF